jgi:prevent-host-death family protein
MKTYPLNEARSDFSNLMDRALAGEPQRITRYGKDAVVVVSEAAWAAKMQPASSLGELLADYAEAGKLGNDMFGDPYVDRTFGVDFE